MAAGVDLRDVMAVPGLDPGIDPAIQAHAAVKGAFRKKRVLGYADQVHCCPVKN